MSWSGKPDPFAPSMTFLLGSTGKSFSNQIVDPHVFFKDYNCGCRTCSRNDPLGTPSPQEVRNPSSGSATWWLFDKETAGWKKESIPGHLFITTLLFQTQLNRSYRNSPSVDRKSVV